MGTACVTAPQHKRFCSMDLPLLGWRKECCCEPFTGSSFPGSLGLGMSYKETTTLASSRGKRPEHSLDAFLALEDFLPHISVGDTKEVVGHHRIPSGHPPGACQKQHCGLVFDFLSPFHARALCKCYLQRLSLA